VKLIRDRIPQLTREAGQDCVYHVADPAEHVARLRDKLIEEATEAATARAGSQLAQELADVLEVVWMLAAAYGWNPAELERLRCHKHRERGGFALGLVWHGHQPTP
jgi:predicted house-cleaning noncanonical NTP pyrophosphatase (MazG superfamily)